VTVAARTYRRDLALVAGLAIALRLGMVLASPGGPGGSFGYDASVYYAAADALLHGRLPYRDFLLLHPPGVVLALLPVAALGQVVGDHAAFVTGNTLFTLLGGVSAALVVVVARQHGLPRRAALLGGLFYAVWFGAVQAEVSARLEPLGSALLLTGLALLGGDGDGATSRRRQVLAGLVLGTCVSTKVWWAVPVLLVLGHQVLRHRRAALPGIGGTVLAGTAINLPFLLAAPGTMWRMVVTDQLSRPRAGATGRDRLADLATLRQAFPHLTGDGRLLATSLVGAGTAVLIALAWRTPRTRLLVVIAGTQLALVLAAPTYFVFYAGFLAATVSLTVAAAAAGGRPAQVVARLAVAAAVALTTITAVVQRPSFTAPVRGADEAAAQLGDVRCLVSDTPMALIQLGTLSRGLEAGCPNWVDVSGRTYDLAKPPPGVPRGRRNNPVWQADLRRYLLSGDAVVLFRTATGADEETLRLVRSLPVLVQVGDFTVHRVP
jgi:hypothetical protein